MNTTICMQSPIVTKLVRKLDEHLNAQDIPITPELRTQFLSRAFKVDFTTVNPVRSLFDNDNELFDAYLEFTEAIVGDWDKLPSIRTIEVISLNGVNATVSMDFY